MRNILIGLIIVFFFTPCLADVHKFRGSDGSALLTNRKPQIRKDVLPSVATEKDLVLNVSSPQSEGVEYTYQGSKKLYQQLKRFELVLEMFTSKAGVKLITQ